jgi:putative ABC transport system permease protein
MPVILRIAFRNMWEHKSKTLIIGILVALGCMVLVLGNAFMDSSERGIRQMFIENFTGDVMIHGPSDSAVSIFGVESMSMDSSTDIPTIPEYETVLARVKADPRVKTVTSMTSAYGLLTADGDDNAMSEDDNESMIFGMVFGVDSDSYFTAFPAVKITAGRLLASSDSASCMLSKTQLDKLAKKYGHPFGVGDKVLINGFGTAGMKIREVTVVGVYSFASEDTVPFVYTDVETARILGGLTLGSGEELELPAEQTALLASTSDEDVFGDDMFSSDMVDSAPTKGSAFSAKSASDLIGDVTKRDEANRADTGAWNFLLIRLKNSSDSARFMADYKAWLGEQAIDARLTDWKGAAGTMGSFADILRVIFYIALIIVSVVAVIIMMNTLVVSVVERTPEIGTMRALGAPKGFIRSMFLAETLTITAAFGLIGSVISVIAIFVLNALHIEAANDLVKMLFGGPTLTLVPKLSSFIAAIVAMFAVGYLAHLFPVSVALKVEPVKAMGNE